MLNFFSLMRGHILVVTVLRKNPVSLLFLVLVVVLRSLLVLRGKRGLHEAFFVVLVWTQQLREESGEEVFITLGFLNRRVFDLIVQLFEDLEKKVEGNWVHSALGFAGKFLEVPASQHESGHLHVEPGAEGGNQVFEDFEEVELNYVLHGGFHDEFEELLEEFVRNLFLKLLVFRPVHENSGEAQEQLGEFRRGPVVFVNDHELLQRGRELDLLGLGQILEHHEFESEELLSVFGSLDVFFGVESELVLHFEGVDFVGLEKVVEEIPQVFKPLVDTERLEVLRQEVEEQEIEETDPDLLQFLVVRHQDVFNDFLIGLVEVSNERVKVLLWTLLNYSGEVLQVGIQVREEVLYQLLEIALRGQVRVRWVIDELVESFQIPLSLEKLLRH